MSDSATTREHAAADNDALTPHRWRFIEKLQLQIAVVIGLAVMFILAWPTLRPLTHDGAAVYLADGQLPKLGLLALWLLAWSAGAAVLTISARPGAAHAAALLGLGGVCFHSPTLRRLLMTHPQQGGRVLLWLAGELLILTIAAVGATMVVALIRRLVARHHPTLMHPNCRPDTPAETRHWPKSTGGSLPSVDKTVAALLAGAVTLAAGFAILSVLLFDASRGQVLFSLVAAFTLSAMLGQWLFRSALPLPLLLAPPALGVALYLIGSNVPSGPLAWMHLWPMAQPLPIDWIAAGCGGTQLGYWIANRLLEARVLPDPPRQLR